MSAELPKLTNKQAEVLRFVIGFLKENGFPPTCQEICDHFGWSSSNAAAGHIRLIEKKGYVRTLSKRARALRVLHEP